MDDRKYIVRTCDGTEVGYVHNGVWYKRVNKKRHMYRSLPGWAFGVMSLAEARLFGAREVILSDERTGEKWTASIEAVERYGKEINHPGHGRQLVLHLKHWVEVGKQRSLFGAGPDGGGTQDEQRTDAVRRDVSALRSG